MLYEISQMWEGILMGSLSPQEIALFWFLEGMVGKSSIVVLRHE